MLTAKGRDALLLGPQRRRRRMRRLLEELDRRDRESPPPPGDHRNRSLKHTVTAVAIATGLVVMIGGVVAHKYTGLRLTGDGFVFATPLSRPPVVADAGTYAFLHTQERNPRRPVAYDPCEPVEWVLNDEQAPAGSEPLIDDAMARISAATGLQFLHRGRTRDVPGDEPSGLSSLKAPVLIAWTDPVTMPDLTGRVAGVGGSTAVRDEFAKDSYYATGIVALDAPQLAEVLARPNGAAQVTAIIMHELGHVVGLDHVDDPRELMHGDNVGVLDLGPGDRRGLALLGSGRCFH